MINNYILESLKISNPKNLNEFENALREICQKIILYALSQTSFFKNVAFYGGTCLRIFHGLDRFSEDLDFQVTREDYKLNFDQCMSKCLNVLESYGLKSIVHSKPEYDSCEVRRRYIKISHYDIANEYFGKISMNKEKIVSIKIEVSTKKGYKAAKKAIADYNADPNKTVVLVNYYGIRIPAIVSDTWNPVIVAYLPEGINVHKLLFQGDAWSETVIYGDNVRYNKQTLTAAQKAQARKNIDVDYLTDDEVANLWDTTK